MPRLRLLLPGLAPALALLALPGCGGGERPAPPSGEGTEAAGSAIQAAPDGGDPVTADRSAAEAAEHGLVPFYPDGPPAPDSVPDGAPIRPDFHSFGHVPDGKVVSHTFHLRNVEDHPIAITGLHPGCGCTAASVAAVAPDGTVTQGADPGSAEEPWVVVPTGGEARLTLRVDTRDVATKNRDRTIESSLVTDAEVGRYRSFDVHFFVEQVVQVNPRTLHFGDVPISIGATTTVDLVPLGPVPHDVTGVRSAPAGVRVELAPAEIQGHATWELAASLDPPLELGPKRGTVVLDVADPDGTPWGTLSIDLDATVVPDLRFEPQRLVLVQGPSDDAPAVGTTDLLSLCPGERLSLRTAVLQGAPSDVLHLTCEPVDPDSRGKSLRWRLTLTAVAPLPEPVLRGNVHVVLDRGSESELDLPWVAHRR